MVNKWCMPGCQSNNKKKDVEYKYVPILVFLIRKISEMNGKGII